MPASVVRASRRCCHHGQDALLTAALQAVFLRVWRGSGGVVVRRGQCPALFPAL
jgi:hypothetical protein